MASRIQTLDLLALDSTGLQRRLDSGLLTSVELVQACLTQIDKHDHRGAKLNALISLVPYRVLMERSAQLDNERAVGRDAIATGPSLEVATTLGSLALKSSVATKSAAIVSKLEDMGAIVLGKTNLNEFCNFKGDAPSNGWSAIGGQTQSAYLALTPNEKYLGQSDPCGSSTGSAVGVSAGYAPIALGTESYGSIVMPASRAGLYAFKAAHNTVNMHGIFRSSLELDVVGGLAKSTNDLALLSYAALTESKRSLLSPEGYQKHLIGNFDDLRMGFVEPTEWSLHPHVVQLGEVIIKQMNDLYFGALECVKSHAFRASVTYPVDMPPAAELWYKGKNPIDVVISHDGKQALEDWLDEVKTAGLGRIEDIIKFNTEHQDAELPENHPDQNQLLIASRNRPPRDIYEGAKQHMTTVSRVNGIDKLFRERNLNLLAFPMDSPMMLMSAASGYPIATVPVGVLEADGRPYGLGIIAQAGSEGLMFQFMSAFEKHSPPRPIPTRLQQRYRSSTL